MGWVCSKSAELARSVVADNSEKGRRGKGDIKSEVRKMSYEYAK
jgi:hypothetical protein